jgi:hypothetical protein
MVRPVFMDDLQWKSGEERPCGAHVPAGCEWLIAEPLLDGRGSADSDQWENFSVDPADPLKRRRGIAAAPHRS